MYVKYAESRRWKTEMMSLNENGIGGFKEVTFMIQGQGAYSRLKYESGVHLSLIHILISDEELSADNIIPKAFDKRVGPAVAKAVAEAAGRTGVARI